MRQAKAARAIGMSQREFVETYGDIDYVPREADMDPPVVQHTLQNMRNELETKSMNPLVKLVGLKIFDSVFDDKTQRGIQKWEDMKYYWKSFADLFKEKGKRVMGQQKTPGFKAVPRRRLGLDPRDEPEGKVRSLRHEGALRDFVRETIQKSKEERKPPRRKKKKKDKDKKKKTGVGWGNPAGPGVSSPGGVAGPGA